MIEALLQIVYILLLLIVIAFLGVVAIMVVVCGYWSVIFRIDSFRKKRREQNSRKTKRKAK